MAKYKQYRIGEKPEIIAEKGADIQRRILRYLVLRNYIAVRVNSGAFRIGHGRFFKAYTIANNGKSAGFSDVLAMKNGRAWLIEVKTPGETQRDDQKEFQALCEGAGMVYIRAESLEDVREALPAA